MMLAYCAENVSVLHVREDLDRSVCVHITSKYSGESVHTCLCVWIKPGPWPGGAQ